MIAPAIEREALRRILASLIAAEITRSRGGAAGSSDEQSTDWGDDRPLSVGAIALDSLEIVQAGAALHEMFAGDAIADEAPLRPPATVGQWLDHVAAMQRGDDATLTVMTSGSTGRPKPCSHAIHDLQAEAAYFAEMLPPVKRVIALVPAHHIYGLIWTALLPARLGVPVIVAAAPALPRPAAGDLIVAVPDHWRALSRSRRRWPAGICGVSAGAPLDDGVAGDLRAAGLEHLYDVYGSSEAGGIALRDAPQRGYVLLPRWCFASPFDADAPVLIDRHGREVPLADRLVIGADMRFTVAGRTDGAVQVGGVNVWPEQVADVLRRCPGVAEISVRLGDQHRLKAFVVPQGAADEAELLDRLRRRAIRLLAPEQRPTAYTIGHVLPRDALGKPGDWR